MAKYMTQKMSSGIHVPITYYREQPAHPDHKKDSGPFSRDAKAAYVVARGVTADAVEVGKYMSDQGVPTGGECEEI